MNRNSSSEASTWSPISQALWRSPWGIAALLQLPYVALYLYYLWASTHYQFYPILLAAIAYLLMARWSDRLPVGYDPRVGRILGIAGLLIAISATTIVSAWLGYLGFVLIFAAWLSLYADRDTGRSLSYLAWPLLIVWQPPYSDLATADTYLITYLQQLSARMSSRLLDVLNVPHFYFGSVIELADRSFSVEQGCSGVQSFFAILCIAALMMVWFRRPFLHTVLIMLSSVVWTVLMNTLRITAIPLASLALSIDLSHGTPHQLIGFAAMGLATWMLLSTDHLLLILLGRPPSLQSVGMTSGPKVGSTDRSFEAVAAERAGWTPAGSMMCLVLGGLAIVQSLDLQKKFFRLVGGNIFLELRAEDLPNQVGDWRHVNYEMETRTNDADFGERSNTWSYQSELGTAAMSIDQTFRMWHDLTVCYRNAGWTLEREEVVFGEDKNWQTVYAKFGRKDGRFAILLYGLFDRSRLPLEVPGYLDIASSVWRRLKKRFSYSAGELFREQTCYQVQVFLETDREAERQAFEELMELFDAGRTKIRDVGISRLETR